MIGGKDESLARDKAKADFFAKQEEVLEERITREAPSIDWTDEPNFRDVLRRALPSSFPGEIPEDVEKRLKTAQREVLYAFKDLLEVWIKRLEPDAAKSKTGVRGKVPTVAAEPEKAAESKVKS